MATDITRYVTLKSICSLFLDQYDKSVGDIDKVWLLSWRALVDIFFNISAEPKTVRIPINGNQTFTLPNDYLKWSKIGVLNGNYEVSTLKINNGLTKWRDNNPNRISQLIPDIPVNDNLVNGLPLNPYYLNFWTNGAYFPLFGIGGGMENIGEVTVDEKNGVIVCGANYPYDNIMLEYLSSPEKDDDYRIEIVCQEAVIAFIAWKMKLDSDTNYYARLTEARRKLKPIQLQKLNEVLREGNSFKVKA